MHNGNVASFVESLDLGGLLLGILVVFFMGGGLRLSRRRVKIIVSCCFAVVWAVWLERYKCIIECSTIMLDLALKLSPRLGSLFFIFGLLIMCVCVCIERNIH